MITPLRRLTTGALLAAVALTSACGAEGTEPAPSASAADPTTQEDADTVLSDDVSAVATYYADNGAFPADGGPIVLSEGTVVEFATSKDGASYCLRGWNPQGSLTEDNPGYFDSASGADGLVESQFATGVCADEDAEFTQIGTSS